MIGVLALLAGVGIGWWIADRPGQRRLGWVRGYDRGFSEGFEFGRTFTDDTPLLEEAWREYPGELTLKVIEIDKGLGEP